MLTVLCVCGTRPEAIKLAPLMHEFGKHPDQIRPVLCSTGQHREMLDQALRLFDLTPDYELNVMQPNQTLAQLTATLLTGLDAVIQQVRPDWILAVGDTATVFVSSLLAYYNRVAFGHVEAGLRTGDRFNPYPEEAYRRMADFVADAMFAPTERARQNLLREGYPEQTIYLTGNTVVDALLAVAAQPYDWSSGPLASLPADHRIVFITAHRRESFGEPFRELCRAIHELAGRFAAENVHFVYPVHLNPNVRQPVYDILSGVPNVSLIEPLDYRSLVHLLKRSTLVLTDSGGIQEEAPTFGVPVLVMRETTERPEGIEANVARLVGTQRSRIVSEAERLLCDPVAYAELAGGANPYGDGQAARRITSILLERA